MGGRGYPGESLCVFIMNKMKPAFSDMCTSRLSTFLTEDILEYALAFADMPTLRALRCILTSFCSKPAANQKRAHRHTQTISLSKLLISSVFLYLSSGVFCVKCPNKAVFCVVVAGCVSIQLN